MGDCSRNRMASWRGRVTYIIATDNNSSSPRSSITWLRWDTWQRQPRAASTMRKRKEPRLGRRKRWRAMLLGKRKRKKEKSNLEPR